MGQLRSGRQLLEELLILFQDAVVLVAVVAAIYLPVHYLIVPVVQQLFEALDVSEAIALPVSKLLKAGFALFAVFAGVTVSGLASFFAATQAITAGATIAIGFASRDVLGNLVSGAFIVLDPTYNIGDWIQWKDREGIIEDIGFRVTRVHTFDNELVVVPNSELTGNAVTNPAAKDRLRVTIPFEVDEEESFERVKAIIVDEALSHPGVLERPAPTAEAVELGEATVIFEGRFWIPDPARTDFDRVRSDLAASVTARFVDEDVSTPPPQRKLSGELTTQPPDVADED